MPLRSRALLWFASLALLLVSAACRPQPALVPTATAPAIAATTAPSPSPASYPTLPPEWTVTPTPTPTHTPLPPTPTQTFTPVPTLAFTVTASLAGAVFTGTAALLNAPLVLLDGLYRVDWEYIGPDNTAFVVRLASPDSNSTVTFVDSLGPQRGASDLRIVGTADLLLSVAASGAWVVFIQPYAGSATPVVSGTPPTPTPTIGLPAPT